MGFISVHNMGNRPNSICFRRWKTSFTLIELLVVISIIAILASMLLPALNQAKTRAKIVLCIGNLKQLGSAILQYSDDHETQTPPTQVGDPVARPGGDAEYGYVGWGMEYDGVRRPVGACRIVYDYISSSAGKIFFCPLMSHSSHQYDGVVGWVNWKNPAANADLGYFTRVGLSLKRFSSPPALMSDIWYAGNNLYGHPKMGDMTLWGDGSVSWVPQLNSIQGPWHHSDCVAIWNSFDAAY